MTGEMIRSIPTSTFCPRSSQFGSKPAHAARRPVYRIRCVGGGGRRTLLFGCVCVRWGGVPEVGLRIPFVLCSASPGVSDMRTRQECKQGSYQKHNHKAIEDKAEEACGIGRRRAGGFFLRGLSRCLLVRGTTGALDRTDRHKTPRISSTAVVRALRSRDYWWRVMITPFRSLSAMPSFGAISFLFLAHRVSAAFLAISLQRLRVTENLGKAP
jgi:hypothetical protein